MKVKNENFHVGDRFRGQVNNEIFVVEARPKKGDEVFTVYGGHWTEKSDKVQFRCERTGQVCKIGLKAAQRLSLERVEE